MRPAFVGWRSPQAYRRTACPPSEQAMLSGLCWTMIWLSATAARDQSAISSRNTVFKRRLRLPTSAVASNSAPSSVYVPANPKVAICPANGRKLMVAACSRGGHLTIPFAVRTLIASDMIKD
jgi:hypothetical protein